MTDFKQLINYGFACEPDRVLIREGLAQQVIQDIMWDDSPYAIAFSEAFDIDPRSYLAEDNFFHNFTRVITRKSDGRKFGFTYWDSPGNSGSEPDLACNAEEHGFSVEWSDEIDDVTTNGIPGLLWVFLPVKPIMIPGYTVGAV